MVKAPLNNERVLHPWDSCENDMSNYHVKWPIAIIKDSKLGLILKYRYLAGGLTF